MKVNRQNFSTGCPSPRPYCKQFFRCRVPNLQAFSTYLKTCQQVFKDLDQCPIETIKGLTDKEQFQYLIKLNGPQDET